MEVEATDHNGIPPTKLVAVLDYRNVDGYHVFTSEDVDGLYIASKSPETAIAQIIPTIEALLEHNKGGDWEAKILPRLSDSTKLSGHHVMQRKFVMAEKPRGQVDDDCAPVRRYA